MPLNEHSWCTEFVSHALEDDKGRQSWPSVVNRLSFQVGGPAVFFRARKMALGLRNCSLTYQITLKQLHLQFHTGCPPKFGKKESDVW